MPIFEYTCISCKASWEELQKISEPNLEYCPFCQAKNPKKLISLTSFRLKGDGWYKDGYSKKQTNSTKNSTKDKK